MTSDRGIRSELFFLALVAALVLAAAVVSLLPLSLRFASALPDDGDALQGLSVLSWVAYQAPRSPLEIFDSNLYFPHPKGLVYSEHLIPQGLVVGLLMKLGPGPVAATNLLVVLTIVSIGVAVALWAREIGASRTAAAVAALVSALGTTTLDELSRVQMLWLQWIPLGLFFLHRFFRRGSLWDSIGFALCFVLQGLSGQYHLVSVPFFLAPIVFAYGVLFPERRSVRDFLRLAVPFAIGGLLLLPVEWPYLTVFSHYGFRRPLASGADLLRYLAPPPDNLLFRPFFGDLAASTTGANYHFVGFATLLLALVGVGSLNGRVEERRYLRIVSMLAVVGLAFVVLSAGADVRFAGETLGPGPFRLLHRYVPFFDYTRVPERLGVYFVFGLALVAGRGASTLLARWDDKPRARALAAAALSILLPLEHVRMIRPTPIPTGEEIPDVYRWLAVVPGDSPVVELPVYERRFLRFFGYDSYFSSSHWKPVPFGKASFNPPALEFMRFILSAFPSAEATRLLQALGVRTIVYHPHRDHADAAVVRRLRRDPHYAFVREFGEAAPIAARLGYGGEVVFHVKEESRPPESAPRRESPIPRDRWTFATSSTVDPRLAVDDRRETAWSTMVSQRRGQFFEVDLGEERRVSRISLGVASPYDEFPRRLSLNGFHPSRRWERLELDVDPWRPARLVERLVADPKSAMMDLVLGEPVPLERVRLFIDEDPTDDLPPWSIPEIRIYEARP